jgi:Protein of unknown function (DUF3485)
MTTRSRVVVGAIVMGCGLTAQAALEHATRTVRPELKAALDSLPMRLGEWVGTKEEMDPDILRRTQATDYINRVYEHPKRPGRPLKLWINYSETGLNLRHSPEVCLPSGGWNKNESQCRVIDLDRGDGKPSVRLMRLGYGQGDMVQGVGFWYYIFGEGRVEQYVRSLPITSRSSHGRTTRGSGLTVEVFCPGESDPDGAALREFSAALLDALEPILPEHRAQYHIP